MKKLLRWIGSKIRDAENECAQEKLSVSQPETLRERSSTINFSVHMADNGYVLEAQRYNRKEDEYERKLYIINDSDDVGTRVGEIITIESLRR